MPFYLVFVIKTLGRDSSVIISLVIKYIGATNSFFFFFLEGVNGHIWCIIVSIKLCNSGLFEF